MTTAHAFISYAKEDAASARELHQRLQGDGYKTWVDEHDLLPGQDWDQAIRTAIRQSGAFIVVLSRRAVTKAGYVQKEIVTALEVAERLPENRLFIIPVLVETCEVPERLRRWHWIDLRVGDGYRQLTRALQTAGVRRERHAARRAVSQLSPFDLMLHEMFVESGRFLYGRVDKGRQGIGQGHFLELRRTIPPAFRDLRRRISDYRRIPTEGLLRVLPEAGGWRLTNHRVTHFAVYAEYEGAIALRSAAGTTLINERYWKLAMLSAEHPQAYLAADRGAIHVGDEEGQLRMLIMPLRYGDEVQAMVGKLWSPAATAE